MHPCKEDRLLFFYQEFFRDIISFPLNINLAPFSRKTKQNLFE